MPTLVPIAQLWTLVGHPTPAREWPLERKLQDIAAAKFAGICTELTPEHRRLAERVGLQHLIGFMFGRDAATFAEQLRSQKEAGAAHVNVHLGAHDMPPRVALKWWLKLEREADRLGLQVAVETHRNTCTETPEKLAELAERYHDATGRVLPLTLDFSHLAVVKHLEPEDYASRLLGNRELVENAQQAHFRPFNGHHCQVAVTYRGELTPEVQTYLPFVRDVIRIWKAAPLNRDRTLFAIPELGPYGEKGNGYNITGLPKSWDDAKRLKPEIDRIWRSVR